VVGIACDRIETNPKCNRFAICNAEAVRFDFDKNLGKIIQAVITLW
jgi:hypothetical protein